MSEKDIRRMLKEVRQSLERSQRTLEALEERQSSRSTPPPPPPAAPKSAISYVRRKTASYDASFLEPKPAEEPPVEERPSLPTSPSSPAITSPLHVPPLPPPPPSSRVPADEGRYTIIQPRSPKKRR